MTDAVLSAIEQLYTAFADAKRPSFILCSPVKDEREYQAFTYLPLKQINAEHAAGYASSVFYTVGSLEDFEYAFPRLIELATEDFTGIEREVLFKKPVLAGWPEWRHDRRLAFQAYLDAIIGAFGMHHWPYGRDLDSWVCALSFCMPDLDSRLEVLLSGTEAADHNLLLFFEANSKSLLKR